MSRDFVIRPADRADAADMAILDDMAGHGLPSWIWQKSVEQGEADHAFAYGREMMMRRDLPNGWQNCRIAETEHLVAGMATSYAMPSFDPDPAAPASLAPVLVLMNMARGSWFVDALAVYPPHRRRNIASHLLEDAFERARSEDDATEISLIVHSDNEAALALYRSFGFSRVTRRPCIETSGLRVGNRNLVLMSAPL